MSRNYGEMIQNKNKLLPHVSPNKRSENRSSTTISSIPIHPALNLSNRRGPEVELYDVAGAHLLSSQYSSQFAHTTKLFPTVEYQPTTNKWFTSCFKQRLDENDLPQSPETNSLVFQNNKTQENSVKSIERSLYRLPFKTPSCNNPNRNSLYLHKTATRLPINSFCTLPSRLASFLGLKLTDPLSPTQHTYYDHGFTLPHRRDEILLLLTLLILVSFGHVLSSISPLFSTINTPNSSVYLAICWIRAVLLLTAGCVSVVGLLFTRPSRLCAFPQTSSSLTEPDLTSADQPKCALQVMDLLTMQNVRAQLRHAQFAAYASSILLSMAVLPWTHLCIYLGSDNNLPALYDVKRVDCGGLVLNFSHLPRLDPIDFFLPSPDSLWTVLWIILIIHSIFDTDTLWSKYWRFLFTIPLCALHLFLANIFGFTMTIYPNYAYVNHSNHMICCLGERCNGAGQIRVDHPLFWWDAPWMVMFRANAVIIITMVTVHLIGHSISSWVSYHRRQLFLLTGLTRAKLHHLQLTESKLDQLSASLVPAPLSDELARDFMAGFLCWRSPLVIYLRNVSFLSAELVGLSTLASFVSKLPSTSDAHNQFTHFCHHLFNCFDQIAQTDGCYRVRLNASEYLCVAGYPETRVDHARSCVDVGLGLIKLVDELSEISRVHLELRVAVHTGTAYAAVLGRSRLQFELTGEDLLCTTMLRQSASRPNRVLVSCVTFNQLPEGFRGEAGPVFKVPPFPPFAVITTGSTQPTPPTGNLKSYFVQPRVQNERKSAMDTLGPNLVDLCNPDKLDLFNTLVRASSTLTHHLLSNSRQQQQQQQEVNRSVALPLGYLVSATPNNDDASLNTQNVLMHLLSCGGCGDFVPMVDLGEVKRGETLVTNYAYKQSAGGLSTGELLTMAAVNLAHSFEQDQMGTEGLLVGKEQLLPSHRRTGRLRNKCTTTAKSNSIRAGGLTLEKSMGTSITTTATANMFGSCAPHLHHSSEALLPNRQDEQEMSRSWKPHIVRSQIPWLLVSPPDYPNLNWLTMLPERPNTKDGMPHLCCYSDTMMDADEALNEAMKTCRRPRTVDPHQWLSISNVAISFLLAMLLVIVLINALCLSGFHTMLFYVASLFYLAIVMISLRLIVRIKCFHDWIRPLSMYILLIVSIFALSAVCLISMSLCSPVSSAFSYPNKSDHLFISRHSSVTNDYHTPCPLSLHYLIVPLLICLLPAIVSNLIMFEAVRFASHRPNQLPVPYIPQITRLAVGLLICLVNVAIILWLALDNGLFNHERFVTEDPNPSIKLESLLQCLFALAIFSLSAFLIPRSTEFQSRLMHQWTIKGHDVTRSLSTVHLALARLLLSTVPPHVFSQLCTDPKESVDRPLVYSNCLNLVGLAVIQLSAHLTPDSGDKISEPSENADRLRLINHVIGMIDALADRAVRSDHTIQNGSAESHSNSGEAIALTKVFVDGTVVGYAVGVSPHDCIQNDQDAGRQMARLVTFVEQIIDACETINAKSSTTHSIVHARIALHSGSAIVNLISQQHPVFTIWGDPLNVCLYLLHESHLPILNRQHLLLATNDLMRYVPPSNLESGSTRMVWRCVDNLSGHILLSSSHLSTLTHNNPPGTVVSLHFCSIPISSTYLQPSLPTTVQHRSYDHDYENKAAFALIDLARNTSLRAVVGTPQVEPKLKTKAVASPPQSTNHFTTQHPVAAIDIQANNSCLDSGMVIPVMHNNSAEPTVPVCLPTPPPPPPHQRTYPSNTQSVEHLTSVTPNLKHSGLTLTNQKAGEVVLSPIVTQSLGERNYSEPPRTSRRAVVSQCILRNHDYSKVHCESPPTRGRVISQLIDNRVHRPDYSNVPSLPRVSALICPPWTPSVPQLMVDGAIPVIQRPMSGVFDAKPPVPPHNPAEERLIPPTQDIRPQSLSSTESFLAAERACAVESDSVVLTAPAHHLQLSNEYTVNENGCELEVISHHNPLYTDNEYDSMADSQGDLLNFHRQVSPTGLAESPSSSSGKNAHRRLFPSDTDLDTRDRIIIQLSDLSAHSSAPQTQTTLEAGEAIFEDIGLGQPDSMDFPAIRRPVSPTHDVRNLSGSQSKSSFHFPSPPKPSVLVDMNGAPSVFADLSTPSLPENNLNLDTGHLNTSHDSVPDLDETDDEYMASYSIGPAASMIAQPSINGEGITTDWEAEYEGECTAKLVTNQTCFLPSNSDFFIGRPSTDQTITDSPMANLDTDMPDFMSLDKSNSLFFPEPANTAFHSHPPFASASNCVFQTDHEDVFAYHFNSNMISARTQNNQPQPPSSLYPNPSGNANVLSHFVSVRTCNLVQSPNRPTLPEIAPVGLPNFAEQVPPMQPAIDTEYDNVCANSENLIITGNFTAAPGRGDWLTHSYESDAMSGYIGDAASSVYDTGDDDDDEIATAAMDVECDYSVPKLQCTPAFGSYSPSNGHILRYKPNGDAPSGVAISRVSSNATSGDSSVGQQKSEYDNVDRSSANSTGPHPLVDQAGPFRPASRSSKGFPQHQRRHPRRHFSAGQEQSCERSVHPGRELIGVEIVAEARRICNQFQATGWRFPNDQHDPLVSNSDRHRSPLCRHQSIPCTRELSHRPYRFPCRGPGVHDSETMTTVTSQFDEYDDETHDVYMNGFTNGVIGIHREELSMSCCRSHSAMCLYDPVESAPSPENPMELAPNTMATDNPIYAFGNSSEQSIVGNDSSTTHNCRVLASRACRRSKSTRHPATITTLAARPFNLEPTSPGFTRLKERAARVRSLFPPELQPFILAGCVSSLSRSSSIASNMGVDADDDALDHKYFQSTTKQTSSGHFRSKRWSSNPELVCVPQNSVLF